MIIITIFIAFFVTCFICFLKLVKFLSPHDHAEMDETHEDEKIMYLRDVIEAQKKQIAALHDLVATQKKQITTLNDVIATAKSIISNLKTMVALQKESIDLLKTNKKDPKNDR